jgi:hypothetical protein
MMYFPPLLELSLVGVANAGTPNRERILLRPTEKVNLAQFGILLGLRAESGLVTPIRDSFFWFGEIEVEPPSWIGVYTGSGTFKQEPLPGSNQMGYWFYWGRNVTAFDLPRIVPVVFRMSNILIGGQIQEPSEGQRRLKS